MCDFYPNDGLLRFVLMCVFCCVVLCCVCVSDPQNSDYTTGQVFDLSEKLEQSEAQLGRGSFMLGLDTHDRKSEDKLAKATRDRYPPARRGSGVTGVTG